MKKVTMFLLLSLLILSTSLMVSAKDLYDGQLAEKINEVVSQGPDNGHFQIDASTLALWIKEGRKDFQVLDVREGEDAEETYNKAHIPPAIYIPYSELFKPDNLNKLDRNKTIIVVCHMGATEELVIVPLRMLGFKARALLLGMASWQKDYPSQEFVRGLMETANKGQFPTHRSK